MLTYLFAECVYVALHVLPLKLTTYFSFCSETMYHICIASSFILCPHLFNFFCVLTTLVGQGLISVEISRSHSDTPHSIGLLSRLVIGPSQRLLPDCRQYSLETNIHHPARDSNPQFQEASSRNPRAAVGISHTDVITDV